MMLADSMCLCSHSQLDAGAFGWTPTHITLPPQTSSTSQMESICSVSVFTLVLGKEKVLS